MAPFSLFLFSYLLTLFGFLLGNTTKEEHKELKNIIKYTIHFCILASYLVTLSLIVLGILPLLWGVGVLISLLVYLSVFVVKKKDLVNIHFIFSFILFFSLINTQILSTSLPLLLLIISEFFRNSLKKWNKREFITIGIILCLLYILLIRFF